MYASAGRTGPSLPAPEALILSAADGYRLGATRYPARHPVRGQLVVAGATGVTQRFYRRFAQHASARGFHTLTFDYRGVGASRTGGLKGFQGSFLDWGRLDLAAAVDAMAGPGAPLFLVGHSFGGQALGLLPNHNLVAACYSFGCGAGWAGWMPPLEALKVRLLWRLVLPLLVAWKGYLPWSLLGMGEDLPLGVYRQWRRWCSFPHYFFDAPETAYLAEQYARVGTPIAAATALDDAWVTPRSRDAFMRAYRNAPCRLIDIDAGRGRASIGHMGYFRPAAEPLWDGVLAWFEEQRARPA